MTQRSVLFYRDFRHFSGGHQKVFDYFQHVNVHKDFTSAISFSPASVWDNTNPWHQQCEPVQYLPNNYDVLFVGGMDWIELKKSELRTTIPVINLIQHVRHGQPDQDVFPFLGEKAIRICVSKEVQSAILETGHVNGPVVTIQNGVNVPIIKREKTTQLFIDAIKQPELGQLLADKLNQAGVSIVLSKHRMARSQYFEQLAESQITLLLPNETEGFYLPILEAMQLSHVTVVPDCIGNRGFCHDMRANSESGNCLFTRYDEAEIFEACLHAVKVLKHHDALDQLKNNARKTVRDHSLESERESFHSILDRIDELWESAA